ncbi:adaptin N terminal region-domain-containing protein [Mycena epipterygia]|nr:adaptin N terminal region-domain-containing protein [Mycena epipterygia]
MAPPLVTLLSSPPEVQWVALRNINLLLQKRPEILSNEMRVFFCKYNDPLYVKIEKLDIMVRLAAEKNISTARRDFGDDLAGDAPSGLAATEVLVQPAARKIVTGLSENPLDDLVSIINLRRGEYGNGSLFGGSAFGGSAFGNASALAAQSPPVSSSTLAASPPQQTHGQQPQEDLLGLF